MRFSVAPNQQKPSNCKAFRNRNLQFDTKVDANQNSKFSAYLRHGVYMAA